MQGAERLARPLGSVCGISVSEDLFWPDLDDGIDLAVYLLNALEVRRDNFARGDFTGSNLLRQRRYGRSP
jgi:hypothetical protein